MLLVQETCSTGMSCRYSRHPQKPCHFTTIQSGASFRLFSLKIFMTSCSDLLRFASIDNETTKKFVHSRPDHVPTYLYPGKHLSFTGCQSIVQLLAAQHNAQRSSPHRPTSPSLVAHQARAQSIRSNKSTPHTSRLV